MKKTLIFISTSLFILVILAGTVSANYRKKILRVVTEGSITNYFLADDAVDSKKIKNGSIKQEDLGSNIGIPTGGDMVVSSINIEKVLKMEKLNSEPFACDSTTEGSLYFDASGSGAHYLMMCRKWNDTDYDWMRNSDDI
jgi:hypothetical protein